MNSNIKNIVFKYLSEFPEEKESLKELLNLISINSNNNSIIFNRKNFDGHITASAFIYCIDEEKLLLLEHKTLNKYLQPGGHIEEVDNRIIDAAKREVYEETGLKNLEVVSICDDINIPFDINIHYIPLNEKKEEEGHYHFDFRYLFIVDKTKDIKLDYNESNDYEWVSIIDLENNDSFKNIIEKIRKLFN